MRLIKIIYIAFLLSLPWQSAGADQYTDAVISNLMICYDSAAEIDTEIVQCLIKKLSTLQNPQDYNVSIHSTEAQKSKNGTLTIFMINDNGYMIYCTATAGEKLKIKTCVAEHGAPLTEAQKLKLSIDPNNP